MNRDEILALAKDCGLKTGQHWNRSNMTTAFMADFANAAIKHYKDSALKEVGEPVLYAEFAEDGGWLGDASEYADHLEEPHALFTSDQVAAAIAKATEPLEDQLATAEQRVAEACADLASRWGESHGCGVTVNASNASRKMAKAIRNGEWRKFVKEV